MQSLQVSNPELEPPEGRDFWTVFQEDGKLPIFTTSEVASVFFGRSKLWMWRHLNAGDHKLDGVLIPIPRTQYGKYQFQLAHVERLAHALFGRGIIDYRRFTNCIIIIKAIGNNYRLL
jgi:hypothetical protein